LNKINKVDKNPSSSITKSIVSNNNNNNNKEEKKEEIELEE
jgi:hypothetical protein